MAKASRIPLLPPLRKRREIQIETNLFRSRCFSGIDLLISLVVAILGVKGVWH
jgi:hypothetical protein